MCYAQNNAVSGINNFLDDTKKVRQSRNDFFKATILTKKRMNEFNFTTMISQVDFFCSFFEEIEDTKKTFLKQLTFSYILQCSASWMRKEWYIAFCQHLPEQSYKYSLLSNYKIPGKEYSIHNSRNTI